MTMMQINDTNTLDDDAADTLRFMRCDFDFEGTDIDVASCHIRLVERSTLRRRKIRDTRQNLARLRDALAAGWDIGPELAYEERRLALLLVDAH